MTLHPTTYLHSCIRTYVRMYLRTMSYFCEFGFIEYIIIHIYVPFMIVCLVNNSSVEINIIITIMHTNLLI